MTDVAARTRRPPPPFRVAPVVASRRVNPRLVVVALEGPELVGLEVPDPAMSVRVVVTEPGAPRPEVPTWTGNEFLLDDGRRPLLRTLTPCRVDAAAGRLELEIVDHGSGVASSWAAAASPGDEVVVSGPARGWAPPVDVTDLLLAGDETAIPALSQVLAAAPRTARVAVHVEVVAEEAVRPLPAHPRANVLWHVAPPGATPGAAMAAAVEAAPLTDGTNAWVAGEAAAVQACRTSLSDRGLPRPRLVGRGYWKRRQPGA